MSLKNFTAKHIEMVKHAANETGVGVPEFMAFVEVEANGVIYTEIHGKQMPVIRWEGHYFHRLLPPALLQRGIDAKLAHPKVGGVKNPANQGQRYQMLAKGKSIHAVAAISSTSWGIGQVMGAHWQWLGYPSAQAFEATATRGFGGQLEIMCRFLVKSGIIPHLKRRDWSAVARIYNGPAYARNRYDVKMREAFERFAGIERFDHVPSAAGMLRAGSKGAAVRELQTLLRRAGFSIEPDGDFGPATERAVRGWQKHAGLEVDGVAGPLTMDSLARFRTAPEENAGAKPVSKIEEVRDGLAGGIGGAVLIETARSKLDEAIEKVQGIGGLEWLDAALTTASAALVLAGTAYAVYGWWKSRQTYAGIEDKPA